MNRHCFLALLLLIPFHLCAQQRATHPDTTENFIIYHIDYRSVELVCQTMPQDADILFCAEAAYTNKPFNAKFTHKKIAGDHVVAGKRYGGGVSPYYSGAFAFYDNTFHFEYKPKNKTNEEYNTLYSAFLDTAAAHGGMAFLQSMVIHNKEIVRQARPRIHQVEYYRSLCMKNGELFVLDTREKVSFGRFLYMLVELGIEEAIYMDMGSGWNHSYYRNGKGEKVVIFPHKHNCTTNWIVFR